MTNALQIFTYKNNEVRTIEIDGEVWFVGKDIADILGYVNTNDALIKHVDDDDKLTSQIATSGQRRDMIVINESGVYSLIFSSKLPTAKEFKHWVTSEVLPAIRKTGSYSIHEPEPLNVRVRVAEVLQRLALQVTSKSEREIINREAYKYATGQNLPKSEPASKTPHTPRIWTAQQIAATLKWTIEAVIHRADDLGIGYWDGETLCFSKTDRTKFLDLVNKGVIKIKDGYEYYEGGFKHIHWRFDADAAETLLRGEE